eukprot:2194018-Amphidinium_carterae.2
MEHTILSFPKTLLHQRRVDERLGQPTLQHIKTFLKSGVIAVLASSPSFCKPDLVAGPSQRCVSYKPLGSHGAQQQLPTVSEQSNPKDSLVTRQCVDNVGNANI